MGGGGGVRPLHERDGSKVDAGAKLNLQKTCYCYNVLKTAFNLNIFHAT